MRVGFGTGSRWIGAAGLACLMATSVPAAAAPTVDVDGTVLSAWERATTHVSDCAAALHGTEIAFSVSDSSGTREGTIAPTGDPALDSSPFLAVDPASRTPVVVWSRFDGVSWKIAYARFDGGAWIDFHYLTFGRTDDALPRLGVSLTGAYLFWVSDATRYMYAPLDLSAGRLFAPPRAVTIDSPRQSRGSSLLRADGSATVNGGADVPIVWPRGRPDTDPVFRLAGGETVQGGGDAPVTIPGASNAPGPVFRLAGGETVQGGSDAPVTIPGASNASVPVLHLGGGETVQGGGDAPVTIPGASSASAWGVGSRDDCRQQVLVIPDRSLQRALVIRFADGRIEVVRVIAIPSPVPETFGEDTARLHLESACR